MATADATFWQTSFERHGSAVLAFLTSRTGRRDVAEDLLQETFVRAMKTPVPLRDPSRVRSYLFSTAHRLMLNARRRRRPLLFSDLASEDGPAQLEEAVRAAPDELTDLNRLRERLDAVLAELPEAQRRAFELVVLGQMSYAEAAASAGWTVDQVRMNVYRGRKGAIARLRELLRVEEEDD